MIKYLILLVTPLTSCSISSEPSRISSDFASQNLDQTPTKQIPTDIVSRLDSRISSLPKGKPIEAAKILSHLGLWKYRHYSYTQRRLNVFSIDLDHSTSITFISNAGAKPITADYIDDYLEKPHISQWDRTINELKIWRVIYKNTSTDIY